MSDPRLEIQMLHDRVMVLPTQSEGGRRSSGGIVIPATASTAKRLVWGEVYGTGQLHAVASEKVDETKMSSGTGLYL